LTNLLASGVHSAEQSLDAVQQRVGPLRQLACQMDGPFTPVGDGARGAQYLGRSGQADPGDLYGHARHHP
jgi:hypothetical protein